METNERLKQVDVGYCKLHHCEYLIRSGREDQDCPMHLADAVRRADHDARIHAERTLRSWGIKSKEEPPVSDFLSGFLAAHFLWGVAISVIWIVQYAFRR